jgi:hypothetical protein
MPSRADARRGASAPGHEKTGPQKRLSARGRSKRRILEPGACCGPALSIVRDTSPSVPRCSLWGDRSATARAVDSVLTCSPCTACSRTKASRQHPEPDLPSPPESGPSVTARIRTFRHRPNPDIPSPPGTGPSVTARIGTSRHRPEPCLPSAPGRAPQRRRRRGATSTRPTAQPSTQRGTGPTVRRPQRRSEAILTQTDGARVPNHQRDRRETTTRGPRATRARSRVNSLWVARGLVTRTRHHPRSVRCRGPIRTGPR